MSREPPAILLTTLLFSIFLGFYSRPPVASFPIAALFHGVGAARRRMDQRLPVSNKRLNLYCNPPGGDEPYAVGFMPYLDARALRRRWLRADLRLRDGRVRGHSGSVPAAITKSAWRGGMSDVLPVEVDARAAGLAPADLIFVFGTRLRAPAVVTAGLFGRGLAPRIVVTGGSSRQADGLNEADHHCAVLTELGVPRDAIIVENASSTTLENVVFALPMLVERAAPSGRPRGGPGVHGTPINLSRWAGRLAARQMACECANGVPLLPRDEAEHSGLHGRRGEPGGVLELSATL